MAKSCVLIPEGEAKQDLFFKLKDKFGREKAAFIYNRVITDTFINNYKDSLTLNEGIPTYESVISNPLVIDYLGEDLTRFLNTGWPHYEDKVENIPILLSRCKEFNSKDENKNFIAFVDYDADNKLTVKVEPRTEETIEIIDAQNRIYSLNKRISDALKDAGITMSFLSNIEVAAGRVGNTNFEHAVDVASNFANLIRIANNLEGYKALSEEFSHLIIGAYKGNLLVKRSLEALKNEQIARQILGNQYDTVSEFYDNDINLIAEEALGHILRNSLLENNSFSRNPFKNLFNRAITYIKSLFKGYNPSYIEDSIQYVRSNMSTLASDILNKNIRLTPEKIIESERKAEFNALSEKAEVQLDVLKKIKERAYKNILLQQQFEDTEDYNDKKRAAKLTKKLDKIINKNSEEEETIAAIYEYLDVAIKDLKTYEDELDNIEELSTQDKFILLRNIQNTLLAYELGIKELEDVTKSTVLEDEHIQNQLFVVSDVGNKLLRFETEDDTETTSYDSIEETINNIIKDSKHWILSEDNTYYINRKTGKRGIRVTSLVGIDEDKYDRMDADNPYHTPSTNIGTGIDELVRDFLSNEIIEDTPGHYLVRGRELDAVYPNASKEALTTFVKKLSEFKDTLSAKGITLISRDVTVDGTVNTTDQSGMVHKIRVVGTLDLLGYDKDGNWYVYDIKTYRSTIDAKKKKKYEKQITLYKEFLEKKYGIHVKDIGILPVKVDYPTPKGAIGGTAEYKVSDRIPAGYKGVKGNQLIMDGEIFKGANPELQPLMDGLNTEEVKVSFEDLNGAPLENGITATLKSLDTVRKLYGHLRSTFEDKSKDMVVKFFESYFGENVLVRETDTQGNLTGKLVRTSIRDVLEKAPKDSNLVQTFFVSAANNPDTLLQMFDKVVKLSNDEKRRQVIEVSQRIMALGLEYEKKGIQSYDWMFEEDKQNYIMHRVIDGTDYSYDLSAYKKAKEAFIKELDQKYGEYPEVGSEEYTSKNRELNQWIDEHTVSEDDRIIPSPSLYPSRYNSLSETQKDFYNKWMEIKSELDALIPASATHLTNTIKIRKTGYERFTSMLSGNALHDFTANVKANFIRSYDDDLDYAPSMQGFDRKEVMKLPLLYLNTKDASDITTDVIGSLIAYADMALNYDAMHKIVNPLEIARTITNKRDIIKKSGQKSSKEHIPYEGGYIENFLYEDDTSNLAFLLRDFMESKVYGRYLKDSGTFTVGKEEVDYNKVASSLLKLGSTVQLGFNALAGLANVATGKAMQRIEAVAGEHFNLRELTQADRIFFLQANPTFMSEIGSRVKTNKLALFDELLDVRQNFKKDIRDKEFINRNFFTRVFGPHMQYICQDAGDHWMYNRSAIAICLRKKLLDSNGEEISLWDALVTVPIVEGHPEYGNKLVLKEGVTNLDGSEFTKRNLDDVSAEINSINQHCFGIYNQEDAIAARRIILGRFVMQYRDFLPAQFHYRFGSKSSNINKGGNQEFEGYYRTYGRFIKEVFQEIKQGEFTIGQHFKDMNDYEKANIKRARFEIVQLLSLYIIAGLLKGLKGDEPDKNPYLMRVISYLAEREKTELGAMVPVVQTKELISIIKSPFAATSIISDLYNLRLCINPWNWTDEIKSGEFKGHSTGYRAFMRSPLTLWYRTIRRNLTPEEREKFYKQ